MRGRTVRILKLSHLTTVEKMVHLESSLCIHQLSGLCTIVSTGLFNAYTRGENAGSRHIAYAQISPRSSAILDWGQLRGIRHKSRTPCGTTCHRYRQYN